MLKKILILFRYSFTSNGMKQILITNTNKHEKIFSLRNHFNDFGSDADDSM